MSGHTTVASTKDKLWRRICVAILPGLALLFFMFAFRYYCCEREVARLKSQCKADFAPFLVESAIAYGNIRSLADGETPAGLRHGSGASSYSEAEQLSLGMEKALSWSLRLKWLLIGREAGVESAFEDNAQDAAWVRGSLCLWLSLGIIGVYWALYWSGCSRWWAWLGALWYIGAPAAVARFTGQQLLKGSFALPFLTGVLALYIYLTGPRTECRNGRWGWRLGFVGVLLLSFAAGANWDMAQVWLGAWAALEGIAGFVANKSERRSGRFVGLLALYLGLVLSDVLIPYNRAHGSLLSPVILLVFPLALYSNSRWFEAKKLKCWLPVVGLVVIYWLTTLMDSPFAGNYRHFADLLRAKFQFLNVKPTDPGLLNFNQRFLWTPELQSATWRDVRGFFPYLWWGYVGLLALGWLWPAVRREFRAKGMELWTPVILSLGFFGAFILMVRFHDGAAVFLALAFAQVLLCWCQGLGGTRIVRRRVVFTLGAVVLLALTGLETWQMVKLKRRYAGDLAQQCQMVSQFRQLQQDDRAVLADLLLGSLLKGYAGMPIVVQPKFELEPVRQDTERYIELLYKGSEAEFAKYCEDNRISFFVYVMGSAIEPLHPDSYRYMADAKDIPKSAVIRQFEFAPQSLNYFFEVDFPRREHFGLKNYYRVFRYVSRVDRQAAQELLVLAFEQYYAGETALAASLLLDGLALDPFNEALKSNYKGLTKEEPPRATLSDYRRMIW